MALMLLILTIPVAGALADTPAVPDIDLDTAGNAAGETRATLTPRLQEGQRLLTQIDTLHTHLAAQAQRALDQADAAPTLDERRQRETLYRDINAKLADLQTARDEIQRQLDTLAEQLKSLDATDR